jgi:hypothetical protein
MKQRVTLPQSLGGLKAWLKGSDEGKALLRELTEEAIEMRLGKKPKVLVVLRKLNGHPGIQVYTEEGVLVQVTELPDVENDTPEIESSLDELLELRLHRSWKHMLGLPAKRIQEAVFSGTTLADWLWYTELGVAVKAIRETETTEK